MSTSDVKDYNEVHRGLPIVSQENVDAPTRGGRYGEAMTLSVVPSKHILADEGSYFTITNPIPGTALAYGSGGTQATFSDTVPFFIFKNNGSASDPLAKRMYIDYIRLIQIGGTAPASTTSVQCAIKIDNAIRYPTAGTVVAGVPVSPNMDTAIAPTCQMWYVTGAVGTIPAASGSARVIGRAQLKGGPTLLLDEYNLASGVVDSTTQGGYLTTVSSYCSRLSPIILGPQQYAVMHLWFPGGITNPFTYEFDLGYWER